MTVTIRLRGGREITGPTLTAAIRLGYGPHAHLRPNGDPNSPEVGTIVEPAGKTNPGVFNILATVLEVISQK